MMRMIWEQAFASLSKKKLISALLVLMFSLGLFLTVGTASYYGQSADKLSGFYTAYNDEEYRYALQVGGRAGLVMDDSAACAGLVQTLGRLRSTPDFSFYTFTDKVLNILDYKGPDRCLYGYDSYAPQRESAEVLWSDQLLSVATRYLLSPDVFEKFAIPIARGVDFSDFDCTWREGMVIPLVLGWEYLDYYQLGDRITASADGYFQQSAEYEVVGFLSPDAAILPFLSRAFQSTEETESLARTILCPAIDVTGLPVPERTDNPRGLASYGSQVINLCTGIVVSPTPQPDVAACVDPASGAEPVTDRTMILTKSFRQDADAYFNMLIFASILILSGSTLCLTLNLINKLLANFKTYAVHMVSGCTLAAAGGFMIAETALILAVSIVLALTACVFFGAGVFTYSSSGVFGVQITHISLSAVALALGLAVAVGVLSLAYPLLRLRRTEFDTLLRGRE